MRNLSFLKLAGGFTTIAFVFTMPTTAFADPRNHHGPGGIQIVIGGAPRPPHHYPSYSGPSHSGPSHDYNEIAYLARNLERAAERFERALDRDRGGYGPYWHHGSWGGTVFGSDHGDIRRLRALASRFENEASHLANSTDYLGRRGDSPRSTLRSLNKMEDEISWEMRRADFVPNQAERYWDECQNILNRLNREF